MTSVDYPQVGRGWAYPPRWSAVTTESGAVAANLRMNDGITHVQQAMVILLRTLLGSRVMRPDLGAGVDRYVFEARTSDVCYRLADDVRRTLMIGERRVIVDEVTAHPSETADDQVDVIITYRIDRHRRPESLVVPFYVAGGA